MREALQSTLKEMGNNVRTGGIVELKACVWLLQQGYEVFRNVLPCGLADIMAWNKETGEILKINVKTLGINRNRRKKNTYHWKGVPNGVRCLGWDRDTDQFMWMKDGQTKAEAPLDLPV
jgi:hypothetical protein